MKVRWTAAAREDRLLIYDFIELDSPQSAALVDSRIWNAIQVLCRFPVLGREGRVAGTRELVVRRTPYIVAYRVEDDFICIIRFLHRAQKWPRKM